jgi:hypothetical protein
MRTYVTPKETRLRWHFLTPEYWDAGSYERSGICCTRYRDLHDQNRYVTFLPCGKMKTIQRPDFEPFGYGSRVRMVRRYR